MLRKWDQMRKLNAQVKEVMSIR